MIRLLWHRIARGHTVGVNRRATLGLGGLGTRVDTCECGLMVAR